MDIVFAKGDKNRHMSIERDEVKKNNSLKWNKRHAYQQMKY